jgi:phosphatidylserine decarboxylase
MKIVKQGILTRWLPQDPAIIQKYHTGLLRAADPQGVLLSPTGAAAEKAEKQLSRVILEFKKVIEEDPEIFRCFHEMFKQVPQLSPADAENRQITNYLELLVVLDKTTSVAPSFSLVSPLISGVPMYGILAPFCDTEAGYRAFTKPKVNEMIHKVFDEWSRFLVSPGSRNVLTEEANGWFGPDALKEQERRLGTAFQDTWVCDRNKPNWNFTSWDDFFVRRFQPRARPTIEPGKAEFINNPCEAITWRFAEDVEATAEFWIKEQPYSLQHMLNYDPLATQLDNGKVFQAILSSMDYHRWHSPVDGRVVKAYIVPGSYYAAIVGSPTGGGVDIVTSSIAYQTAVCTRAIIFIESDNPDIGLMCFIGVGLVEVSTIQLAVREGDRIKKGDEIGSFHFGGSTYVMVFRPETKLTLLENLPEVPDPNQPAVHVGKLLFHVDN